MQTIIAHVLPFLVGSGLAGIVAGYVVAYLIHAAPKGVDALMDLVEANPRAMDFLKANAAGLEKADDAAHAELQKRLADLNASPAAAAQAPVPAAPKP